MSAPDATVVAPLGHSLDDREARQRDDVVQFGLWMFLATVTMLFAAFSSAYIVRRGGTDWVAIDLPPVLWLNTAVLVASSAVLEVGRHALARSSRGGHARVNVTRLGLALWGAAALGLAFLAGQVSAWRTLSGLGLFGRSAPHGSFAYLLTGAHAAHVIAGLLLLLVAAARTWRHRRSPTLPAGTARLVTAAATFWHFLAGLWLYVFAFVSMY